MGIQTAGALVVVEDFAGLGEVEDLSCWVVLEGIEEGRRRLGEEDAFAPAGGHGGDGREAGQAEETGDGREEEGSDGAGEEGGRGLGWHPKA